MPPHRVSKWRGSGRLVQKARVTRLVAIIQAARPVAIIRAARPLRKDFGTWAADSMQKLFQLVGDKLTVTTLVISAHSISDNRVARTFTQNEPNINTLSGRITDSKATLSGSPYSFSTFNRELKKSNGVSAEPNVQSIIAGDMTLHRDSSSSNPYDNRIYARFVINARVRQTTQGTVSFQYSDAGDGSFYP